MTAQRTSLLILQPTPFCNLNCDYCYLTTRHSTKKMAVEVVAATMSNMLVSDLLQEKLTVVWHAGEPLVMPARFFEASFRLIAGYQRHDLQIDHAIQTNGTLVTEQHCALFRDYGVNVGVSIDGPAFIHDAHRRTRTGTATHAQVMEGVNKLLKYNVKSNVITVLTDNSLDFPDEMYEFYLNNNITRVGFNIEEIEGHNGSSSFQQSCMAERYARFMERLLQRTHADGILHVREFMRMQQFIASGVYLSGNSQNYPLAIVSVDADGNFSTFSPELLGIKSDLYGNFAFGNVKTMRIRDVEHLPRFQRVATDIQTGVQACKAACKYFPVCGGGDPSNKFFEHGTFRATETLYCKYTKKLLTESILRFYEEAAGTLATQA